MSTINDKFLMYDENSYYTVCNNYYYSFVSVYKTHVYSVFFILRVGTYFIGEKTPMCIIFV